MITRRDFYCWGTNLLGGLITLGLAVPGVGYLLDPLLRGRPRAGGYRPVTRLGELPEGVPRVFAGHRGTRGCVGHLSPGAGRVSLAGPSAGGRGGAGGRVHGRVPPPGLRSVPRGRRPGLLLPLPSEPLRPPGPAVERRPPAGWTVWTSSFRTIPTRWSSSGSNDYYGTVSDFVLGSYVLSSKPKTKSDPR